MEEGGKASIECAPTRDSELVEVTAKDPDDFSKLLRENMNLRVIASQISGLNSSILTHLAIRSHFQCKLNL